MTNNEQKEMVAAKNTTDQCILLNEQMLKIKIMEKIAMFLETHNGKKKLAQEKNYVLYTVFSFRFVWLILKDGFSSCAPAVKPNKKNAERNCNNINWISVQ